MNQTLRKYRNDSLQTYENLPLETSNLYTKYTDAARMDPEIVKIAAMNPKDIPHIVQIENMQSIDHCNKRFMSCILISYASNFISPTAL